MLWLLNRHPEDSMCTTASGNIMATFHIFIARFKSTNVGWARRMLRYNCSSPPRPAVVCCCGCGCAVVYLLNMQYIISAKHGVGHYSCLCLTPFLRGINCNYLVLIGPRYQLGAAGHQDTASRSTHIQHCPFNWSSWRRWKRWRDEDIFQNIRWVLQVALLKFPKSPIFIWAKIAH